MRLPLLLLALCSMFVSAAVAENDLPQVTVFGTATTQVQPDLLRWRLSVERAGAELAEVADSHATDVAAVLEFLKQQKIPAKEIQTSEIGLAENREWRSNSWIKDGYKASAVVTFTSKDLGQYRALWLGLARLKGVSIESAEWDSSRRISVQNTTRDDALKAAKEKAASMATALGVKLAEPLAIKEVPLSSNSSPFGNYIRMNDEGDDEGSVVAAPGSIEVRVRVQVAFRIVTR